MAPERLTSVRTVPELFLQRVKATPDREAYRFLVGSEWRSLTWRQTGERVRDIALGLTSLGLTSEQRCAILSGTRVEWILVDLGILCAGGATTTIYPSSTPEDCVYILADSETVIAIAEDDGQVAKLSGRRAEIPTVKHVVVMNGKASSDGWVITLEDLENRGRELAAKDPQAYERTVHAVKPDALATLIYTSGTTGKPKGVELTQDCWIYEGEGIENTGILGVDDLQYLWLPMAHSFGKVLEAVQLRLGFATAVDGRVDKIVENLAVIQPTFVCAVPRIFEKVHGKVVMGAQQGGGLKLKIFTWAMGVGTAVSRLTREGKSPGAWLAFQNRIADKLVFSKLKARFGGRVRFFISGSAPLARELSEFFHAAGLLILEGYGLTESSAGTVVNRTDKYRFGTVGMPLDGTKLQIAEDGEILIKGRGVMRGYWKRPQETAEVLTADGWLKTGDIGRLHPEGFLEITDRKKDLIKTSGGKYVAPQELEGRFKASCPYVSQILVHGNNRNYCSALIALDPEGLTGWAKDHGLGGKAYAELTQAKEVRDMVGRYVDELNTSLARHEQIKKFAILPADLSEAAGDLTPSLKLKRKVVEQKYKATLDGFYEGVKVAD